MTSTLFPVTGSFSAPRVTRGTPAPFSTDKAGKYIAYAAGRTCIVRFANSEENNKGFVHVHPANVTSVRLSADGKYCCSGDEAGNLNVWYLSEKQTVTFKSDAFLGGPIRDAAFDETAERLVAVSDARGATAARAVAIPAGNKIGEIGNHSKPMTACDFRPKRPFRIFTGAQDTQVNLFEGPPFKFNKSTTNDLTNFVTRVRFSPDGSKVACTSGSKKIPLLNGETGEPAGSVDTEHSGTIMGFDWSREQPNTCVTASADKSVHMYRQEGEGGEGPYKKVWSTEIGTKHMSDMQYAANFIDGGKQVVALGLGGRLSFLAPDTGAVVATKYGHSQPVKLIAQTGGDDEGKFITASADGRVVSWKLAGDGAKVESVQQLPEGKLEHLTCAALSSDNKTLVAFSEGKAFPAAADFSAPFKDAAAGFELNAKNCAAVPGGAGAGLVALVARKQLAVIAAATGETKATFDLSKLGSDAVCVAANPKGDLLAVGCSGKIAVFDFDAEAKTITAKFELKGSESMHMSNTIQCLAFSPSGNLLAAGDGSRVASVWNLESRASTNNDMSYHNTGINTMVFFDEQTLATGSGDEAVFLWNLAEKKRKYAYSSHCGGCTAVAKVGNFIVSAGATGNIHVFKP